MRRTVVAKSMLGQQQQLNWAIALLEQQLTIFLSVCSSLLEAIQGQPFETCNSSDCSRTLSWPKPNAEPSDSAFSNSENSVFTDD